MNQRQKQTLPRERAHKNAIAGNWGAFNGPLGFAMGSHSAVTSFRSTAESSPTRIESTYATAHCFGCNDTFFRKDTPNDFIAMKLLGIRKRKDEHEREREKPKGDRRYFHSSWWRFNISESSCRKVDRADGERNVTRL
ncbi:hypothetical protein PUN28_001407 [Cardiocondyla obscurior]|uniref:Uncharacterized protein n=1 Tax=Cardiocondyla obscurior TaxID=286306 RepID=A0AAW2H4T8_9HYME